jgi:hypothetical protein
MLFRCRHAPRSLVSKNSKLSSECKLKGDVTWNYLSGVVTQLISLSCQVFVYSEQVRTLWTRCKLVILNVFIGQFWIFGHLRPKFYQNPSIRQTFQYKLPHFKQKNMRKLANIARRVFGNLVQASYFDRFHWSILFLLNDKHNFLQLSQEDKPLSLYPMTALRLLFK